jgi:hypothetical protein
MTSHLTPLAQQLKKRLLLKQILTQMLAVRRMLPLLRSSRLGEPAVLTLLISRQQRHHSQQPTSRISTALPSW